jgi:hypothetical protein
MRGRFQRPPPNPGDMSRRDKPRLRQAAIDVPLPHEAPRRSRRGSGLLDRCSLIANPKSKIVNPQSKDHSLFAHGEHIVA